MLSPAVDGQPEERAAERDGEEQDHASHHRPREVQAEESAVDPFERQHIQPPQLPRLQRGVPRIEGHVPVQREHGGVDHRRSVDETPAER
jgi:hypothetical protein